ncbi:Rv3235 family protein [Acidipropionibacterium timonense]|uniref:Rv3235 family protein n=1 Tax=Acidipropionibacterium timonense TaxID=2161818 RepID=UPI00102FC31E|nr:Rv3235 family protein [Acidipropionibacterium timonense]
MGDLILLASADGVELYQCPPWLPLGGTAPEVEEERPGPDQPPLFHGLDDLVDPGPATDVDVASSPIARDRRMRVVEAATRIVLECMAGRRPMVHLARMSSHAAMIRMRLWPRGPVWSQVTRTAVPFLQCTCDEVHAVIMVELPARHVALAMTLRRIEGTWRLTWADVLRNRRVDEMLRASPAS